jgi:hypothetical protein
LKKVHLGLRALHRTLVERVAIGLPSLRPRRAHRRWASLRLRLRLRLIPLSRP